MGLLSFLCGLIGCRASSNQPAAERRVGVTAEFNHMLGPLDRAERYEDPLDELLQKHGFGEIDGGGTLQTKDGEIEYCDVHMLLNSPDASLASVIQLLESRGAPKGSKLQIHDDGDKIRVIPFCVRASRSISTE